MNLKSTFKIKNYLSICIFLFTILTTSAQQKAINVKDPFWEKVQFGGGFGLGIGSGYTDITIAPNAIYYFNKYVGLGVGIQGSYNKVRDQYSAVLYGVNSIAIYNPIDEVQVSLEVEQVRVNVTYNTIPNPKHDNFWNTGLYLGAGYRTGNVTAGLRYNVLFDKNKSVNSDALMPFVRFSL
jgi:hypothetical protein